MIRRVHEADPLVCPRCGATMRIVEFITEPKVIHKILRHLAAIGVDARKAAQIFRAPPRHRLTVQRSSSPRQ